MRKIKVVQINDSIRSQLLVGEIYSVKSITECGMVKTKCGRWFEKGEYELVK